jgi:hypothetical protein
MNPKSIFNLFSLKGKVQAVVHQGVATLIISSVALSLALTACMQIRPASEPMAAVTPPQAKASEQHSIEVLPNIDPADRKFFSPGYGAISEGLPTAATEPQLLAWPPRPTQFRMANNAVTSPNEPALAAYHQSEWGRIPNATLPVGENTWAAYHQSEWGRPLNTVLPIAKHETDADQDLGLMEFSPGVNEAGMHRHAREYGPAAFSHLPEIDADQDVGLMEFFPVPDETSRQHTEPVTFEALPNIDPADRKFFSPGYGAPTTSAKRSEAVLSPMENKIGTWSAIWFLLK